MAKQLLKIILPLALLLDIIYSFFQHYSMPLDGDMAPIILPTSWYRQVLNDPLGLSVFTQGEGFGGIGRFFCHWSMYGYYNEVPVFLQYFADPVDSVYWSGAIIKIITQLVIIWALAAYISGRTNIRNYDFLVAALLVTPLFQTHGYNLIMGVIEKSPTYFFFYSLPFALLLLFFLPIFLRSVYRTKIKWSVLFLLLALVLPFSGPLLPATGLMVCPVILFYSAGIYKNRLFRQFSFVEKPGIVFGGLPKKYIIAVCLFLLLSLYSFYIGRFNVENSAELLVSPGERYLAMLEGIYKQLSQKLGLTLLLAAILFNYWLLRNLSDPKGQRLKVILQGVSLFCLAYLILLPLGGFRGYRSLIIRHDTMMPVTIGLIYMFGASAFYLLKNIQQKYRRHYTIGVAIILSVFTLADMPNTDHHRCEQRALTQLSESEKEVEWLDVDCHILSWQKIKDPADSWLNKQLLKRWRILEKDVLYYQGEKKSRE